ncbi:MAG TPA: hypothetical protein VFP13_01150 [Actinomycetota bacterium]|nr:hypothetical protein [Actinomycetota bacterium]
MTVDRAALERRWIHSHEEDTAGEMVFRPDDYDFPASRGRLGFELRHDGGYLETAIGPTDRPEEVTGTWTLAGDDTLVVTRASPNEPERALRILSATPERLVVAKG